MSGLVNVIGVEMRVIDDLLVAGFKTSIGPNIYAKGDISIYIGSEWGIQDNDRIHRMTGYVNTSGIPTHILSIQFHSVGEFTHLINLASSTNLYRFTANSGSNILVDEKDLSFEAAREMFKTEISKLVSSNRGIPNLQI